MLDLKRIREDPAGVAEALARRDPALKQQVEQLLAADEQWRTATTAAETLRAEQKARSQEFGAAKSRGEDAPELREAMQELAAQVKQYAEQATVAKEGLDDLVARLPNLPDPSAADGPDDCGQGRARPKRSSSIPEPEVPPPEARASRGWCYSSG